MQIIGFRYAWSDPTGGGAHETKPGLAYAPLSKEEGMRTGEMIGLYYQIYSIGASWGVLSLQLTTLTPFRLARIHHT